MKILATNDIHQAGYKWKEVVKACKEEKPDVLVVAGDLFPNDYGILEQFDFVKHLKKYAQQIKDEGVEIVLTLGNDDNQLLIPEIEKGRDEGLWNEVHNKVFEIDGYEFAGMPYVPDYPFGYKFWCHPEFKSKLRIDPQQFGRPVIVNEDNQFEAIPKLSDYMASKISIYDTLVKTSSVLKDVKKSIWLIHAPPATLGLDICAHGARVGSEAVLKFIQEYQPFITIHGHIHESPEYNGHKWYQNEGETICIQGGQMCPGLYYSVIKIQDGKIIGLKHSIYGQSSKYSS